MGSSIHNRGANKSPKMVMTMIPIKLAKKPTLTISQIFRCPLPNTMALGAVAAGSIKAQDAARVTEIISGKGSIPICSAADAKMGRIISVEDMLDVSSVKKLMKVVLAIMDKVGMPLKIGRAHV